LDAAGNTTAAIGKGFAIGSACLVSLSLYGAFVVRAGESGGTTRIKVEDIKILDPLVFAMLLIGSMLPYWFAAMCMKSVGKAALEMVQEVRNQIKEKPGILNGTDEPNYDRCISISTKASLA